MEKISSLPVFFNGSNGGVNGKENTPYEAQKKFATLLNEAIHNVNESQVEVNTETEKLINNETSNLHDVMIAAEKAAVTMQVTLEVRNKMIEAYQEIMRMPL